MLMNKTFTPLPRAFPPSLALGPNTPTVCPGQGRLVNQFPAISGFISGA
ncbi:hypothetical protein [Salinicola halophyticus]